MVVWDFWTINSSIKKQRVDFLWENTGKITTSQPKIPTFLTESPRDGPTGSPIHRGTLKGHGQRKRWDPVPADMNRDILVGLIGILRMAYHNPHITWVIRSIPRPPAIKLWVITANTLIRVNWSLLTWLPQHWSSAAIVRSFDGQRYCIASWSDFMGSKQSGPKVTRYNDPCHSTL